MTEVFTCPECGLQAKVLPYEDQVVGEGRGKCRHRKNPLPSTPSGVRGSVDLVQFVVTEQKVVPLVFFSDRGADGKSEEKRDAAAILATNDFILSPIINLSDAATAVNLKPRI